MSNTLLIQIEQAIASYIRMPQAEADRRIRERFGVTDTVIEAVRQYMDDLNSESEGSNKTATDFRSTGFNALRRERRKTPREMESVDV